MQRDRKQLEAVQKFALKIISHHWDLGYRVILNIVSVSRLSGRKLYLKLAQTYVYIFIHDLSNFVGGVFKIKPLYYSRFYRTDTIFCPFA